MDLLRIERTGLLHTRPSGSVPTRAGKRETPAGPGKSESVSFPGDAIAVRISYDKDIGRVVAKTHDTESGRVVRQLPPEEFVAFLKWYRKAVPLIVDKTAYAPFTRRSRL